MNRVLVAHGTRMPDGVEMIASLADRVGEVLGGPVRTAFVDVLGPTPTDVLAELPDEPTVVVPAFLSRGYHVRADLPAHVAASGRRDVVVTDALGPSLATTRVLTARLVESGWRTGDSVILGAAGTSDPRAQRDLRVAAATLSAAIGQRVELAFAATGEPTIATAVDRLRHNGGGRVCVASYLLADGLFQGRLESSGADAVSRPLGTHTGVIQLIASRFRRARVPVAV